MLGCQKIGSLRYEELTKRTKREGFSMGGVDRMGRRHVVGPPGAINTVTPCAACKLLRRRCAQECPFSPYFSPHEPQKFAAVHKVFGASNVSKMLMEVPEAQRYDTANSLVYEANLRMRDPVYGCMGAISTLQQQCQILEAELNLVRAQLLKLKYKRTTVSVLPTCHAAMINRCGAVPVSPPSVETRPLPPAKSNSSSSSMYTLPSSSTDYSSITIENVPLFG